MQAQQTGRMANSSYVGLFFPCSEEDGVTGVAPLDVILSALSAQSGSNPGDGLKVTIGAQAAATTITSGSFPTISATQSCILFSVLDISLGFSITSHGDATAGERIVYTQSTTTVDVEASGGTAVISDATAGTGIHGRAVAVNRGGNVEYLVDGVVVGTPVASPSGPH